MTRLCVGLFAVVAATLAGCEYAAFARQPDGITLRLASEQGMAGRYAEGHRRTASYDPSAYVLSISISRR